MNCNQLKLTLEDMPNLTVQVYKGRLNIFNEEFFQICKCRPQPSLFLQPYIVKPRSDSPHFVGKHKFSFLITIWLTFSHHYKNPISHVQASSSSAIIPIKKKLFTHLQNFVIFLKYFPHSKISRFAFSFKKKKPGTRYQWDLIVF